MKDPVDYHFCYTPESFDYAMSILSRASFLILACEGNNLGRANGSISLICVGTPLAEHIFIIDCLSPSLTANHLARLWTLFKDRRIIKVVWDGRMDYLEIWSTYGVALEGVLDLQVAEVVSRFNLRGEGESHRLDRLTRGWFSRTALFNHSWQYTGLNALTGLQKCCEESGFGEEFAKDRKSCYDPVQLSFEQLILLVILILLCHAYTHPLLLDSSETPKRPAAFPRVLRYICGNSQTE